MWTPFERVLSVYSEEQVVRHRQDRQGPPETGDDVRKRAAGAGFGAAGDSEQRKSGPRLGGTVLRRSSQLPAAGAADVLG